MRLHPSITLERVIEGARESMFGMEQNGCCTACGEEAYGVEPDATHYECESCGEHAVSGWELILFEVQA